MNKYIIGADEVGYGCWAGSLYVVALKAEKDWVLKGLNDSKKLSEKKRQEMNVKLLELVKENKISYAVSISTSSEIDKHGVADCLKLCYGTVISKLYCDDSEIILDGTIKPSEIKRVMEKYGAQFNCDLSKFRVEVKADAKFPAVMGASILAKVGRDSEMKMVQHAFYPQFGFNTHVGYGTKEHKEAINKYGLTPIHRRSYEPMKSMK